MLVAEGAVDISAETDVKLWDLAALQVIVEEAGGVFTDLTGKPTPSGGSAVCTNGLLHEQVLRLLSPGAGQPHCPDHGRGLALRRAKSDAGQIRCHKCTSCQRRQPRHRHERSDPA